MNDMIRQFRDLAAARNINVVFLSWIDREKDDVTGRITHEIDLGKSLQNKIPGMVDVVGLLYKNNEGIPVLQLDKDMGHPGVKFRRRNSASWSIPNVIEEPTLAPILEVLHENIDWDTAVKKYPFIHPQDRG